MSSSAVRLTLYTLDAMLDCLKTLRAEAGGGQKAAQLQLETSVVGFASELRKIVRNEDSNTLRQPVVIDRITEFVTCSYGAYADMSIQLFGYEHRNTYRFSGLFVTQLSNLREVIGENDGLDDLLEISEKHCAEHQELTDEGIPSAFDLEAWWPR